MSGNPAHLPFVLAWQWDAGTIELRSASSTGDALPVDERAQATRPDVFLLDIGLPRMHGHERARRLRTTDAGRDATLIALTVYGQASEREKAQAAGFDHYMVKPPDRAALQRLRQSLPILPR